LRRGFRAAERGVLLRIDDLAEFAAAAGGAGLEIGVAAVAGERLVDEALILRGVGVDLEAQRTGRALQPRFKGL
jgi:hypothetical protein